MARERYNILWLPQSQLSAYMPSLVLAASTITSSSLILLNL
jgi:hypothetical protein